MAIPGYRKLHRVLGPLLALPIFVTSLTGVWYRVSKSWFGGSEKLGNFLMYIHQGTFLGDDLRVFYVLLNGLGVISMLASGMIMTGIFRIRRR